MLLSTCSSVPELEALLELRVCYWGCQDPCCTYYRGVTAISCSVRSFFPLQDSSAEICGGYLLDWFLSWGNLFCRGSAPGRLLK